jgi:hypothetical protein
LERKKKQEKRRKKLTFSFQPKGYSSHAFRRSGATAMVEGGCTESELLFSGSWSSSKVAREYFEDSQRGAEKRARRLANTDTDDTDKIDNTDKIDDTDNAIEPTKVSFSLFLFLFYLFLFFSFLSSLSYLSSGFTLPILRFLLENVASEVGILKMKKDIKIKRCQKTSNFFLRCLLLNLDKTDFIKS